MCKPTNYQTTTIGAALSKKQLGNGQFIYTESRNVELNNRQIWRQKSMSTLQCTDYERECCKSTQHVQCNVSLTHHQMSLRSLPPPEPNFVTQNERKLQYLLTVKIKVDMNGLSSADTERHFLIGARNKAAAFRTRLECNNGARPRVTQQQQEKRTAGSSNLAFRQIIYTSLSHLKFSIFRNRQVQSYFV